MFRFLIQKKLRYRFKRVFFCLLIVYLAYPFPYASRIVKQSIHSLNAAQPESWQIQFFKAWKDKKDIQKYALFIELNNEWKTYWKYPGDTGFSPKFQIVRSKNLRQFQIAWPTPEIFYENETEIYGFKNKVVLPLLMHPQDPSQDVEFELKINLGFCNDICIPKEFNFKSRNAEKTSEIQDAEIRKFIKKVPIELPVSANNFSCSVVSEGGNLRIYTQLGNDFFKKENGVTDVIFYYEDDSIWFSEKIHELEKKIQTFSAKLNHINDQNIAIDRSRIELTLLTQSGSFTINGCFNSRV